MSYVYQRFYGGLEIESIADRTNKVAISLAGITGSRTITLPDADSVMVSTTATQTLTNKTLTAPIISTISNTGTLTLPTSTDVLVGRNTTDTLTNKTLSGLSNTFSAISLSSLTATTANRVLVSDGSGLISASSVTATTLGYLDASSSIQTQLDAKASTTDLSNHESDTTGIHGITDTAALLTTDNTKNISNKTFEQNILPEADNTRDLGSTSVRFKDLHLGGFASIGATSTPSNPAASNYRFYIKSDGKPYVLNSSGTESQISYTAETSSSISATEIDWNSNCTFYKTISLNTTFSFSNTADGKTITVAVINGTAGGLAVNFPAGIKWAASTALTTLAASSTNIYTFTVINSVIYAAYIESAG